MFLLGIQMISKDLEEVIDYFISMRVCQTHKLLVHSLKSEGAILQLQFSAYHILETCISQQLYNHHFRISLSLALTLSFFP